MVWMGYLISSETMGLNLPGGARETPVQPPVVYECLIQKWLETTITIILLHQGMLIREKKHKQIDNNPKSNKNNEIPKKSQTDRAPSQKKFILNDLSQQPWLFLPMMPWMSWPWFPNWPTVTGSDGLPRTNLKFILQCMRVHRREGTLKSMLQRWYHNP